MEQVSAKTLFAGNKASMHRRGEVIPAQMPAPSRSNTASHVSLLYSIQNTISIRLTEGQCVRGIRRSTSVSSRCHCLLCVKPVQRGTTQASRLHGCNSMHPMPSYFIMTCARVGPAISSKCCSHAHLLQTLTSCRPRPASE
jgi:hypothetical protein